MQPILHLRVHAHYVRKCTLLALELKIKDIPENKQTAEMGPAIKVNKLSLWWEDKSGFEDTRNQLVIGMLVCLSTPADFRGRWRNEDRCSLLDHQDPNYWVL